MRDFNKCFMHSIWTLTTLTLTTNLTNDDNGNKIYFAQNEFMNWWCSEFHTVKNCVVDVTWNVNVGTVGSCNTCTFQGQCFLVAYVPGNWNELHEEDNCMPCLSIITTNGSSMFCNSVSCNMLSYWMLWML
jgi:hypothetical protein